MHLFICEVQVSFRLLESIKLEFSFFYIYIFRSELTLKDTVSPINKKINVHSKNIKIRKT